MRAVLLSSERWDGVWRRNQQLASRIPNTLFAEPARRGFSAHIRSEDNVDVITLAKPLPRRWGIGRRVDASFAARAIRRHIGDEPFVVWATHALDAPLVRALDAPTVYDRTDDWPAMEQSPNARTLVARLDRELLQRADAVVIVSEEMRAQARADARHIPNGVDFAAFTVPNHPTTDGGPLRVAYAGTVDPFRLDMKILATLAGDAAVQLVIAGPGERVDGAENHGTLPHTQLPDLLAGCDALVAPYRVDCEANRTSDSLKLYEYFATGLPVIATPTAGFQRYPNLVVFWPMANGVRDAIERQRGNTAARREIGHAADWWLRSMAMREVLEQSASRRQ